MILFRACLKSRRIGLKRFRKKYSFDFSTVLVLEKFARNFFLFLVKKSIMIML